MNLSYTCIRALVIWSGGLGAWMALLFLKGHGCFSKQKLFWPSIVSSALQTLRSLLNPTVLIGLLMDAAFPGAGMLRTASGWYKIPLGLPYSLPHILSYVEIFCRLYLGEYRFLYFCMKSVMGCDIFQQSLSFRDFKWRHGWDELRMLMNFISFPSTRMTIPGRTKERLTGRDTSFSKWSKLNSIFLLWSILWGIWLL